MFEVVAVCSINPTFEFVVPSNSFTPVNICGLAVVPPAKSASPLAPPYRASPFAFVIKSVDAGVLVSVLVGLLTSNVFVPLNAFDPAKTASPVLFVYNVSAFCFVIKSVAAGVVAIVLVGLLTSNLFVPVKTLLPPSWTSPADPV